MKPRKKRQRRRNVYAASLSRFRPQVKPSAKTYRRKPKHKSPRTRDGGFFFDLMCPTRTRRRVQVSRTCT